MESSVTCRGGTCDKPFSCVPENACQYKSSADEAREVISASSRPIPPDNPFVPSGRTSSFPALKKVGDFEGKIDGQGIKTVMFSPKTAVQLVDPRFIEAVGEVLRFGAEKYAANNWMRGMSWVTVIGGILRHVLAFARGEEMDKESGLPHLAHAACGLMFLHHFAHARRDDYKTFDDRVFK